MEKQLMTGNEAVARGAWEAGVRFASAYPGTPSTEILENAAGYKEDIIAEWAPNEKVALEAAFGASVAGARALAAMKHVGVNVAADPLFTISYTGVTGGLVLVSADEPGHFSSQNEQDNRNYAKAAKIPMFEPSDSSECKEMVKEAFRLSEKYDTPVLCRMTTRVCHGKSLVEPAGREERPVTDYVKNIKKYIPVPSFVGDMRRRVEERMIRLSDYSENTPFNFAEYQGRQGNAPPDAGRTGVIASGICYRYAKEVFGDTVSYLKLGFTNPLPEKMITEFARQFDTLYVIEENDPYIEEKTRMLGFDPRGYGFFPYTGEMTADVLRKAVYGSAKAVLDYDRGKVAARPPALCAGCPHRGFFYRLGKRKDVVMCGDIGCYALAFAPPYHAMDLSLCMGASFSMAHGMQQVFDLNADTNKRLVAFLGDSTFFHMGVNSLIGTAYNGSRTVNVILDNRITGMTGHQENPGTGFTLQGKKVKELDIEALVRACGIEHVFKINPNSFDEADRALDAALALDAPSVIITRWPCVLKKLSEGERAEFGGVFQGKCKVDAEICVGCKLCMKTGCPAISFDDEMKKVSIAVASCAGCEVCLQACPKQAITKAGN